MDYIEEWQFIYRGVDCAIVHHGVNGTYRPKGTWCFYIMLSKHRFVDKKEADVFFLKVQKSDTSPYESRYAYEHIPLEMHGDITFYNKTTALNRKEGLIDSVKIGCDYAHYYDEGCEYTEKRLQVDAKKCVDEFLNSYTYLVWCSDDGELRLEKDVHYKDSEKSTAVKLVT